MQKLRTCMDALVLAGNVCQSWRVIDGQEDLGLLEMIAVATELDEQYPAEEDMFYMVSGEGAIGIAWKWEFLVRWLYVPSEAFIEDEGQAPLQAEQTQTVQIPQPAPQQVSQTVTAQPAPTVTPQTEPARLGFCRKCGKQLQTNAKFCKGCGTPVI